MSVSEDETEILQLLLHATRAGKFVWTQFSPETYHATSETCDASIEFQRPLLADGSTSGADIVQVTVDRLCITYCSGTPGMGLVRSILASAFPRWDEHCRDMAEMQSEVVQLLGELMPESTEGEI